MSDPQDQFRGDDAHLIACIEALLTLDAKGALAKPVVGHARTLLSAAARRLSAAPQSAPEPVGALTELPPLLDMIRRARQKLATYTSVYPGDKELRGLLAEWDAALAAAPADSGWSDALTKRRDLLLQAADYLQDDAADSDAGGNNSRAEACRASIYALRQIVALVDADAALAAKPGSDAQEVPAGVWEALQRMIEDGLAKGAASQEDARTVARYRDKVRFLARPGSDAQDGRDAGEVPR